MKILKYIMLFAVLAGFAACDSDGEVRHLGVTAVKTLYAPDNGEAVVLQSSASASLYFEWEPALAEDGGAVLYEIGFSLEGGDLASPDTLIAADNNGAENHATITHKTLNQIAAELGVGSGETATLKWTVFSSKGINPVKAEEERTLTLTRLTGFANIPNEVYITGEATEGGADLASALKMKRLADGEFEIYTKLTAGQSFHFANGTSDASTTYSTADGKIVEAGTSTVATEGVYRITLDFNTSICTYTLVTRIGFYFCPNDEVLFDLNYMGNGVFQADNTVTFKEESWGRDERYKFRMFIKENNGTAEEREVEWGTLNATDSQPTADSPDSYYYLQLFETTSQWDNKWKLMSIYDGVPAIFTLYLSADGDYTHSVEFK